MAVDLAESAGDARPHTRSSACWTQVGRTSATLTHTHARTRTRARTPRGAAVPLLRLAEREGPPAPSPPPSLLTPATASSHRLLPSAPSQDVGVGHVLQVVRCLLINPFPESALNEEAGKLLMEDYDQYFKKARARTARAQRRTQCRDARSAVSRRTPLTHARTAPHRIARAERARPTRPAPDLRRAGGDDDGGACEGSGRGGRGGHERDGRGGAGGEAAKANRDQGGGEEEAGEEEVHQAAMRRSEGPWVCAPSGRAWGCDQGPFGTCRRDDVPFDACGDDEAAGAAGGSLLRRRPVYFIGLGRRHCDAAGGIQAADEIFAGILTHTGGRAHSHTHTRAAWFRCVSCRAQTPRSEPHVKKEDRVRVPRCRE